MKKIIDQLRQINLKEPIAIIGSGATGQSFFDLCEKANLCTTILDEKENNSIPEKYIKHTKYHCQLSDELLSQYQTILISPGLDHRRDCFKNHQQKMISDIELFSKLSDAPIIGITGSNGKSTVTTLINDILTHAGKKTEICGNIGIPVLKALMQHQDSLDYYVIELSSYHLEKSPSLSLEVSLLLNISPDHLDRYIDFNDYAKTKGKILSCSKQSIVNLDDPTILVLCKENNIKNKIGFSHQLVPHPNLYLKDHFIYKGKEVIFNTQNSKLMGRHNHENIMAAICISRYLKINQQICNQVLTKFTGLSHRSEFVIEKNGISYINDSKGTNVGATIAAILGFSRPIILIAGGDAKQQDFTPLIEVMKGSVKKVFLFGRDKKEIQKVIDGTVCWEMVNTLHEATIKAAQSAVNGDIVLLSPACASFDQFQNYQQRGDLFKQIVLEAIA